MIEAASIIDGAPSNQSFATGLEIGGEINVGGDQLSTNYFSVKTIKL